MVGYVTATPAFFCGKLRAREASSFYDLWNWPLVISLKFSPFWLKQTFVFLDVLDKEFAYLYLNIILNFLLGFMIFFFFMNELFCKYDVICPEKGDNLLPH